MLGTLGVAALLWPRPASATGLNVERIRLDPEDDGVHGGFQIGVDFQAGNTNRLDLRTSAALAFRRERHVAFLIGSSTYSTRTRAINGEDLSTLLRPESRFVNKANVHARYNFEFLDWLVGETFAQLESNEFLLVESRVLFGLGPRFVPINNGEFSLALGTDYMLEREALDAAQVVSPLPAQTIAHRWSSYLSLVYAATERLSMSSTTYVQPRFDRFSDLRLLSEGFLDVVLVEPISIRLSLRIRWDSQPSIYCSSDVGIGGCPTGDTLRLREFDIAVENSINVSF
ncbi:hypothetical protein ENSA5_34330 [Enhygromyxa salina]|uniref:DUF481 domain-containing protein n=2 Tax=Enhygromyxa salina TaxID=215803 RepID=A0A2S9XXJ1_9BACT|nr:hypothetical protein ENSA5_34330 [Enhygromyxa salina]